MQPQWFRENEKKADVDSHMFPDNLALKQAPLTDREDMWMCFLSLLLYGMFIWMPLFLLLLALVPVPLIFKTSLLGEEGLELELRLGKSLTH
jgi:hypothetical protein